MACGLVYVVLFAYIVFVYLRVLVIYFYYVAQIVVIIFQNWVVSLFSSIN